MQAISNVHKKYNGSMFSEYELIGQSNLLFKHGKQKLVSGMRDHLNGKLNDLQIMMLVILGFKYIAYEHTHLNINSKNMLKRNQTWLQFLKLLIKKLSKYYSILIVEHDMGQAGRLHGNKNVTVLHTFNNNNAAGTFEEPLPYYEYPEN